MTDPISIISLVDIIFTKCLQLYQFFSAVADTKNEINSLLSQLEKFKTFLPYVKAYAEQALTSPSSQDSDLVQDILMPALQACQVEFQAVFDHTESHDPGKSSMIKGAARKLSWVLSSHRIQELTKKLNAAKLSMSLALQISGRYNDLKIEQQICQVVKNQGELSSELRKSLRIFCYCMQQSVDQELERYQESNMKTQARVEDLSDFMATEFPSLAHTQVLWNGPGSAYSNEEPIGPLFPQVEVPGDGTNTRIKLTRVYSFIENDPDFIRALEEFKQANLLGHYLTEYLDPNDLLQGIENQSRKPLKSKSRMLLGLNACMGLLPSESTYAVMGSYRYLLQVSRASKNMFELMAEGLAEASDAIRLCRREYDLYPAQEIKEAMVKLYTQVLEFGKEAALLTKRNFPRRLMESVLIQDGPVPKLIAKIRKQTQAIIQEVEYQQRLEMRDMSSRVRNIERDQQKILSGIASQKKILESLQDQQKIMTVIKTQQDIIYGVQQLLLRIPA